MSCSCYYCVEGKPHPVTHPETYEVTGRLLKAESLNPKDRVRQFACTLCGHITEVQP